MWKNVPHEIIVLCLKKLGYWLQVQQVSALQTCLKTFKCVLILSQQWFSRTYFPPGCQPLHHEATCSINDWGIYSQGNRCHRSVQENSHSTINHVGYKWFFSPNNRTQICHCVDPIHRSLSNDSSLVTLNWIYEDGKLGLEYLLTPNTWAYHSLVTSRIAVKSYNCLTLQQWVRVFCLLPDHGQGYEMPYLETEVCMPQFIIVRWTKQEKLGQAWRFLLRATVRAVGGPGGGCWGKLQFGSNTWDPQNTYTLFKKVQGSRDRGTGFTTGYQSIYLYH